jgi:hypothetical protein
MIDLVATCQARGALVENPLVGFAKTIGWAIDLIDREQRLIQGTRRLIAAERQEWDIGTVTAAMSLRVPWMSRCSLSIRSMAHPMVSGGIVPVTITDRK